VPIHHVSRQNTRSLHHWREIQTDKSAAMSLDCMEAGV
jgi:hypothetical protein